MSELWPQGFCRVPDEDWAHQAPEQLALKYDTVENHGWYSNLARTVEQLTDFLEAGNLILDYSGGTGILADRLLKIGSRKIQGRATISLSPDSLS